MLLECCNSFNNTSLQFEIISDDNNSDITDDNTAYSETNSDLNEDE